MNNKTGNILITGTTGLVGSHLLKALVQQGKKVKALYRSAVPDLPEAKYATWVKGDILDINSLEDAIQDAEQVYHCAALVSYHPGNKKILHEINIEGTANVVNACLDAGVKKLLHVSSVSALGTHRENNLINEDFTWSKETSNSEYGKSKYLAEMEVWRGIGEGLQAVMVNPTIILGVSDWNKGSAAIFKNVYHQFPWYTEGVTGFVDVHDVVRAMILLMEGNISAEKFVINAFNLTYKEMFTEIAINFKKKPPNKKVSPFLGEIVWRLEALKSKFTGKETLVSKETARTAQKKVYFDNSKLLNHFPDFKYTPLQKTLQRVCNEYREMYKLT